MQCLCEPFIFFTCHKSKTNVRIFGYPFFMAVEKGTFPKKQMRFFLDILLKKTHVLLFRFTSLLCNKKNQNASATQNQPFDKSY